MKPVEELNPEQGEERQNPWGLVRKCSKRLGGKQNPDCYAEPAIL
jgi:hypothetical protein